MESAEGLILIYARIRRLDTRDEFWSHIENIPGERVSTTVYELNIADWDVGLWQNEIDWMREIFAGTRESVIIWQFAGGRFSRYTVGGDV
jgi:hypothetical protein